MTSANLRIVADELKYRIVCRVQPSGDTLSLGEGVDREVWHTAYLEYANNTAILAPRLDNTHSLLNSPLTRSESDKTELAIFGALTALLMLSGTPPAKLDPVFVHYLLHDCDIHSITKAIMKKWHSEFTSKLEDFINIGPSGDIRPFACYIDTYGEPLDVRSLPLYYSLRI